MDFDKAKDVVLKFGKYKGQTLDEIAHTDDHTNDGLRYLHWLAGQDWPYQFYKDALAAYLKDQSISKETDKAVAERPSPERIQEAVNAKKAREREAEDGDDECPF